MKYVDSYKIETSSIPELLFLLWDQVLKMLYSFI